MTARHNIAIIHKTSRKRTIESITQTSSVALTQSEDYPSNPPKQSQVKALEQEIDQMVYQLYNLTDEEIRIVKEGVC
ncbi:MAG: hypothetical protein V1749_03690, partial [Candidatus Desantisbacteria bacterium]